jgi:hypothetical protein
MRKGVKVRRQRAYRGKVRERVSGAAEHLIRVAVEREARRYRCSMSMVVANCCAFALGVDLDEADRYKAERVLRVLQGGKGRRKVG